MPLRWAVLLALTCVTLLARSEEGFWPFDMIPKDVLEQHYHFNATDAWLAKARGSTLRISGGGSGAFVSPHGLVMTNRHVVGTALQRLSERGHPNIIRDGFVAKTRADEVRAPGVRIEELLEIINVNEKVRAAAVRYGGNEETAMQAVERTAERGELREHVRVQALKMYPEGEYRIYKFKVFDDVRLVFASDLDSGYFGGDQDNFTFPRCDFDVAFLRAYENDEPAVTPDYFAWSAAGADANELVFFAGNPAATERSLTLAHLEMERDKILPIEIALLTREAAALQRYAQRGADEAQSIQDREHHVENALKRLVGQLDGLHDPAIFARKKSEEDAAAASITDPAKAKLYADAIADMRGAVERFSKDYTEFKLLGGPWGIFSAELSAAMLIAAMDDAGSFNFRAAELRKARLESLYLYDPADREGSEAKQLTESFAFLLKELGSEHALSKLVLEGKSPADRATELLSKSQLGSVEFYRSRGENALGVDMTSDPMLVLAKQIFNRARALNQRQQREFADVEKKCYAQIARALGQSAASRRAPDGNFSPRLSFGTIRGYEDHGKTVRAFTHLGDMYGLNETSKNSDPYHLNPLWLSGRSKLDAALPFNFVTDADGYGGNSGSAVFNRQREIVGMLFDANYPGLVGKFMYDARTKRSICVDSRAILDVLTKLYGATELVSEIAPEKK